MPFEIYPINIIIILLVLMPNILFSVFKPRNIPKEESKTLVWLIVGIFESIGRMVTVVLPFFWSVSLIGKNKTIVLILMGIAIILYYLGWIRYFSNNREYKLLYEPLFFIPLPMAVCPILFLLLSGFLIESWPMVIASLILAVGHLPESYRMMKLCNKEL